MLGFTRLHTEGKTYSLTQKKQRSISKTNNKDKR